MRSVKPNNAKDIFDLDDVDGALVGGIFKI